MLDDPPRVEDLLVGGPGLWIGDTLVRVASRRRRKVKVHIYPRPPGIRVEADPPTELVREVETQSTTPSVSPLGSGASESA